MPVSAEISNLPRSMVTVTPLDVGMAKLCARMVSVSRLRFKLVKPGASLNTRSAPVTDKLPFCADDCGACKSSVLTPDQTIASLWPANKPDKKLTEALLEVI